MSKAVQPNTTTAPADLSRRKAFGMVVGVAALGAPAAALAGLAEPDPIYAAIAEHRRVYTAWNRTLKAYSAAEREFIGQTGGLHRERNPVLHAELVEPAEAATYAGSELEHAAASAVAETVPTTLAGVVAVLRYRREALEASDELLCPDQIGALLASIEEAVATHAGVA